MKHRQLQASIPPFGLRMQPELRDRLKASASFNNRSMNAEIVDRLERSFGATGLFPELEAMADQPQDNASGLAPILRELKEQREALAAHTEFLQMLYTPEELREAAERHRALREELESKD